MHSPTEWCTDGEFCTKFWGRDWRSGLCHDKYIQQCNLILKWENKCHGIRKWPGWRESCPSLGVKELLQSPSSPTFLGHYILNIHSRDTPEPSGHSPVPCALVPPSCCGTRSATVVPSSPFCDSVIRASPKNLIPPNWHPNSSCAHSPVSVLPEN